MVEYRVPEDIFLLADHDICHTRLTSVREFLTNLSWFPRFVAACTSASARFIDPAVTDRWWAWYITGPTPRPTQILLPKCQCRGEKATDVKLVHVGRRWIEIRKSIVLGEKAPFRKCVERTWKPRCYPPLLFAKSFRTFLPTEGSIFQSCKFLYQRCLNHSLFGYFVFAILAIFYGCFSQNQRRFLFGQKIDSLTSTEPRYLKEHSVALGTLQITRILVSRIPVSAVFLKHSA